MKKEKKHSGWFWVVVIGGLVFLSLIEKPLSINLSTSISPYDAGSAFLAGAFEAIIMIVFVLLIFFMARRVDAYFGYPRNNGDAENENNNDEMQEMQERDSNQQ